MRILVLNYEYPPVGGGGGAASRSAAEFMARSGHQVRVLTSHVKGLPRRETRAGVEIRRHHCFRKRAEGSSVPEMMLYISSGLWPAWRQARRFRPDLVHVHFAVPSGVLAWWLRRTLGIPYVLTAHLGDVPGGVPDQTDRWFSWLKPLTVPIWKHASAITAVSRHVQQLAEKAYGLPVQVIFNGIPMTKTHEVPRETREGPLRLVFAGRFNSQKNLGFLLEVLRDLRGQPWNLVLMGDGPERSDLETRVRTFGLQDQVEFTGWITGEAVAQRFSQADVLMLPSANEGLPMVALEALKYALVVVGSRIPGLEDVVEHERNGFLLPYGDRQAFTGCLHHLMDHREQLASMKMRSRERAKLFDLSVVGEQYTRLFQSVLKGSP